MPRKLMNRKKYLLLTLVLLGSTLIVGCQPTAGSLTSSPAEEAQWHYNRGLGFYEEGAYDKAILEFNQAIELDPNYADAYNWRGNMYFFKGEYDQSTADYNKAIELDPSIGCLAMYS